MPQRTVSRIDAIATYNDASSVIAALFASELRFPAFEASLDFYANRAAFARALEATGYDPVFARQTADVMVAVGGYRRILINEGSLHFQPWGARVGLLAHELTHTLQYELGGGRRGASDQWLREGFAEWVAMHVLDRLHATRAETYRRQKLEELRGTARERAPRLDEMATFPQMVALASRDDLAPYAQAFLAVDYLVERHGAERVLAYFRLFADSEDRRGNFRTTFGEDLETFEASLLDRLWPRRR